MSVEGAGYFIIINVKYSRSSWERAAPAEATRNAGPGATYARLTRGKFRLPDLATRSRARRTFPFLILLVREQRASRRDADGFIAEKIQENSRAARPCSPCAERVAETRVALLLLLGSSQQARLGEVVKALFGNIFGGCQESASHKNRGNSVFQMSLRSQRQQIH